MKGDLMKKLIAVVASIALVAGIVAVMLLAVSDKGHSKAAAPVIPTVNRLDQTWSMPATGLTFTPVTGTDQAQTPVADLTASCQKDPAYACPAGDPTDVILARLTGTGSSPASVAKGDLVYVMEWKNFDCASLVHPPKGDTAPVKFDKPCAFRVLVDAETGADVLGWASTDQ